jgi:hypothetical protein
MPLMTYNGTLISGLTADVNCCCSAYNCYCFRQFTNYGSTLVSRSRACYRAPFWNGSMWVFPDGQPCVPNPGCTVTFTGILVSVCSCPGGGFNPFQWALINNAADWAACTTVSPPP